MTTNTMTVDGVAVQAAGSTSVPQPALASVSSGLRRVAWIVFFLQLLGLAIWSTVLWQRFALAADAASYLHESYLIATGHLDPAAIHLHVDLLMWPMSLLTAPWPHGPILLWEQDAATVGAEVVAFRWICRVVEHDWRPKGGRLTGSFVAALGLVVLVANPWTYWADSFDLHPNATVPTLFVILAAYDFSQGKYRRAWIWVVLVLLNGDVAGLYVLGLGVSAFVASWSEGRLRKGVLGTAVALGAVGVGWELALSRTGQTAGATLGSYNYLLVGRGPGTLPGFIEGILRRPGVALKELWTHRLNIYANLAPTGIVGLFSPWCLGVPLVLLIVNQLSSYLNFGMPSYQSLPVYSFGAVGLVTVLCWAGRHVALPKPVVGGVLGIFALNALFWGAVWVPPAKSTWLRISSAQAAVLSTALRDIPPNAEVLAEQGVVGRFSERSSYGGLGPGVYPVNGRAVWLVLAPSAGIETVPSNAAEQMIAELAGPLHAQLVLASQGIWVFRWTRPAGVHRLGLLPGAAQLPAWTAPAPAGIAELAGPPSTWHAAATGSTGYIVEGDYWQEPLGSYTVDVKLATSTPVNVEVWNATSDQLLARSQMPPTNSVSLVPLRFDFRHYVLPPSGYSGWGPFRILSVPNYPRDRIEVRVWTPAGGNTSVYDISLRRTHSHA